LGRSLRDTGFAWAACRRGACHRFDNRAGAPTCSRRKRGNQEKQALGRSRGGFSTKIHLRTNAKGHPRAGRWSVWLSTGGRGSAEIGGTTPRNCLCTGHRNAEPEPEAVNRAKLPHGSGAQDGGVQHKVSTRHEWFSVQPRRLPTMGTTMQSGDCLMSAMPSIIVLLITALLVFRRELTPVPPTSFEAEIQETWLASTT
jgi:hypothetical protein